MASKKKPVKTVSYKLTLALLAESIGQTGILLSDAQKNGDKVATWTLSFIYDDLIKAYHRLGNVRLTIKGDQT